MDSNIKDYPSKKNRFKELRLERGMTIAMVEAETGIGASALGSYENRGIIPRIDKLNTLSAFYGVSIDYLLGKSDRRNPEGETPSRRSPILENPVELKYIADIKPQAPTVDFDQKMANLFMKFSALVLPSELEEANRVNDALRLVNVDEESRFTLVSTLLTLRLNK